MIETIVIWLVGIIIVWWAVCAVYTVWKEKL